MDGPEPEPESRETPPQGKDPLKAEDTFMNGGSADEGATDERAIERDAEADKRDLGDSGEGNSDGGNTEHGDTAHGDAAGGTRGTEGKNPRTDHRSRPFEDEPVRVVVESFTPRGIPQLPFNHVPGVKRWLDEMAEPKKRILALRCHDGEVLWGAAYWIARSAPAKDCELLRARVVDDAPGRAEAGRATANALSLDDPLADRVTFESIIEEINKRSGSGPDIVFVRIVTPLQYEQARDALVGRASRLNAEHRLVLLIDGRLADDEGDAPDDHSTDHRFIEVDYLFPLLDLFRSDQPLPANSKIPSDLGEPKDLARVIKETGYGAPGPGKLSSDAEARRHREIRDELEKNGYLGLAEEVDFHRNRTTGDHGEFQKAEPWGSSPIGKAIRFLVSSFHKLRPSDLEYMLRVLLTGEKEPLDPGPPRKVTKRWIEDGQEFIEETEIPTGPEWELALKRWERDPDACLRECNVAELGTKRSYGSYGFVKAGEKRRVREYVALNLGIYRRRSFTRLFDAGALFAPLSTHAIDELIDLSLQMAIEDPGQFGTEWLFNTVSSVNSLLEHLPIQVSLPADASPEQRFAAVLRILQEHGTRTAFVYDRIAKLCAHLFNHDDTRPAVTGLITRLNGKETHPALWRLSLRLRSLVSEFNFFAIACHILVTSDGPLRSAVFAKLTRDAMWSPSTCSSLLLQFRDLVSELNLEKPPGTSHCYALAFSWQVTSLVQESIRSGHAAITHHPLLPVDQNDVEPSHFGALAEAVAHPLIHTGVSRLLKDRDPSESVLGDLAAAWGGTALDRHGVIASLIDSWDGQVVCEYPGSAAALKRLIANLTGKLGPSDTERVTKKFSARYRLIGDQLRKRKEEGAPREELDRLTEERLRLDSLTERMLQAANGST